MVEDPPPSIHTSNQRTQWGRVFEQVRAEAGKWCRIAEYTNENHRGLASVIVAYFHSAGFRKEFEVVSRSVKIEGERKVSRIFARLIVPQD